MGHTRRFGALDAPPVPFLRFPLNGIAEDRGVVINNLE